MEEKIHPLDAWLKTRGKNREWLAKKAGTTEASISRLVAGKQWVSKALAFRLTRITDGAVTPNDFLSEPERKAS